MDGGTDYVKIAIDCQHFLQIVKIREASATFLGGCLSVVTNDAQNKLLIYEWTLVNCFIILVNSIRFVFRLSELETRIIQKCGEASVSALEFMCC